MSKKYVRHQAVISRNADEHIEEDHWLNQFQKNLQKGAVQPRPVDQFLFDQINSIMQGNSKYPSVEAAVKDMQDRSGLTKYLDKIDKISEDTENSSVKKSASDDENNAIDKKIPFEEKLPLIIKKCPAAQSTLNNIISDTKGNSSIPAILDRLRSIHKKDVSDDRDWDDEALVIFISKVNLEAKKNNPSVDNFSNLGLRDDSFNEIDASNTDAFHALMPAKT